MAATRGCLPLLAMLAVLVTCSVKTQGYRCRRVRGLLTPPCRYYCSYFDGYGLRLALALEKDGTRCGWNRRGICRSGLCFPPHSQHFGFSHQWPQSSRRPLRIRKRDTSSVLNADAGQPPETSELRVTKSAVKTVSGSSSSKGFKAETVKTVNVGGKKKTARKTVHRKVDVDVDPFSSIKNIRTGVSQTETFYSTGGGGQGQQDVGRTGANVNKVTGDGTGFSTSDITTSLQGQGGLTSPGGWIGGRNTALQDGGVSTSAQTTTPGGAGGLATLHEGRTSSTIFGGDIGGTGNFPASGAATANQGGTPGGSITTPASPGLTNTNVASMTTTGYAPSSSTVGVTGQGAFPGGVTGHGAEVEVPGYTTGVGRNWKWVLGRKVGFLPPNVQALDPEILYYKLGYQLPRLPRLPKTIQSLLNRVPVRPVGSDLIGYPGSRNILDSIRRLGIVSGGLPGLRNLLLRNRLSYPSIRANFLRALLTSDSSSPLGLSSVDHLFYSNMSPLGDIPSGLWPNLFSPQRGDPYGSPLSGPYGGFPGGLFSNPYGSPYGGPYGGPYGSPWSGFPGSQFPGSPWPFFPGGTMGPFGSSTPGLPFYPRFPFGAYPFTRSPFYPGYPGVGGTVPTPGLTGTSTISTTSGVRYTLSPEGKLVPTTESSSPIGFTLAGGQPTYSKSATVHSVTSTSPTGVRYVQSPDGTLVPVSDATGSPSGHSLAFPGTDQTDEVIPGIIRSITGKTSRLQGYPRGYTQTPDGRLIPTSDSLLQGLGPLSSLSSDPNSPLNRLLRGPYGADPSVRRYLRSIIGSWSRTSPYRLLRLLGARPGSRLYNSILRKTLLGGAPGGIFGLSGDGTSPFGTGLDGITGTSPFGNSLDGITGTSPFGTGLDGITDLTSLLSDGSLDPSSFKARYLAVLAGIDPALLRPLGAISGGPLSSTTRTIELLRRLRQPYGSSGNDPLTQLLYGTGQPLNRGGSRSPFGLSGSSDTMDAVLGLSGRRPGSQGTTSLRKEITKALLTATQPQTTPTSSKETVISKVVTAEGTSPGQTTSQTVPGSHVVSSTYHATNVQSTSPVTTSPVISGIQINGQKLQPGISPGVLGVKGVSVTSGTSTLPAYGTPGFNQLYPTSTSGVFVNGRFVPTTNGALGTTLGHTGITSPLLPGGYLAYSGIPTTSGLLSTTTTTHPYVLATSPLGGHPHYVVEGHEAPGTRWQLKVWRHRPGVSALIPGLPGVGTSPLSGILSPATQGLTHVLPLGPQPSHFGFTSYQPSSPGLGLLGTSPLGGISTMGVSGTHYIVHAPDGSVVVSRQPGTIGSTAFASPLSITQTPSTLIPGLTNVAGGAISAPGTTGTVFTAPLQTSVIGGTPAGGVTTKYQQVSTVQSGSSGLTSGFGGATASLLDSLGSGGTWGGMGSTFSSGSSGSDSILPDALPSQTKLKK